MQAAGNVHIESVDEWPPGERRSLNHDRIGAVEEQRGRGHAPRAHLVEHPRRGHAALGGIEHQDLADVALAAECMAGAGEDSPDPIRIVAGAEVVPGGEHHPRHPLADPFVSAEAEGSVEIVEIGPPDAPGSLRGLIEDAVGIERFGGHPDHVKHGHGAIARERGAEVLEIVGSGGAVDAVDHRHVPVGVDRPAHERTEGPPFVQGLRPRLDLEPMGGAAMPVEVAAVARRASGQRGADGRGAALEVAARPAHAVGVDDHAGIAEGRVLAEHRRGDGLVAAAGVGHQDPEGTHGVDGAPLQGSPLVLLPKATVRAEIDAARIRGGGHAYAAIGLVVACQGFQVLDPASPRIRCPP